MTITKRRERLEMGNWALRRDLEINYRIRLATDVIWNNRLRTDHCKSIPKYDWSTPVEPLAGLRGDLSRLRRASQSGRPPGP